MKGKFMIAPKKYLFVSLAVLILLSALTLGVILNFRWAKNRSSALVLPGGRTYLGPESKTTPTSTQQLTPEGKIPVPDGTAWSTHTGIVHPYSFSYPSILKLGVFPDDPFDAATIFWEGTNSRENILIRVEDLNKIPGGNSYIEKPAIEYARDWWKQYNWKGVESVTEFTNSTGLKGYRASYIDARGMTPFDNIFFEVPERNDLLIWLSGKLLEKDVFDRLVDSVAWKPE